MKKEFKVVVWDDAWDIDKKLIVCSAWIAGLFMAVMHPLISLFYFFMFLVTQLFSRFL